MLWLAHTWFHKIAYVQEVGVYVCVYACVFVCVHVCACTCVCVCVCVCVFVRVETRLGHAGHILFRSIRSDLVYKNPDMTQILYWVMCDIDGV